MLTQTLRTIFRRDLEQLKKELDLYEREDRIWYVEKNITNSAGNLCLHLVGNLNAFVGGGLGNTGYVRDRPLEFSATRVPRSELLAKVDETIVIVENALDGLTPAQLEADYPREILGQIMTTGFFLVPLAAHLMYHLGQVNYHRRLLDAD